MSALKKEILDTAFFTVSFVSSEQMNRAMTLAGSINLDKMNKKLVEHSGWIQPDVLLMNDYYTKWLAIHIAYPEALIAPNEKLDEYWHNHILDTKKYMEDYSKIFGKYLHHYPYFGLEGDSQDLKDGFVLTNTLFNHHFQHDIAGKAKGCKATSCR